MTRRHDGLLAYAVLMALAGLLFQAAPAPVLAQGRGGIVMIPVDRPMWAVKRANLRSGTGTQYDRVGLLEVGEKVRVTGDAGDWLRVERSDGRTAFVYTPLLADTSPGEQAHRAIWAMHNVMPGETFGRRQDHNRGTAFAIGPRHFITNVHVLLGVLKRDNSPAATRLVQEGSSIELTVRRVLAIHVAHDLVLFETGQAVEHYLPLIDGDAPTAGERLLALGYIDGKRQYEATNGIV